MSLALPHYEDRLPRLTAPLQAIVKGYTEGYFLMADEATGALDWFGTRHHTLMPLDTNLHIPKSLHRVLNQNTFSIRISTDVAGVIAGCQNRPSTWISAELAAIYLSLSQENIVATYEAWQGDKLAGGVLGFWLGGAFIGESMFTAIEDAGKVALVRLCKHLAQRGFLLFDAQLTNPHLERFGSFEMPLATYAPLLARAVQVRAQLI
jgi:leucyl/phenylalanyl-tRNA---protein transferase